MLMFWEGFWFVLFTLSSVNGTFLVHTAILTHPWQRSLATVISTTIFRWTLKTKHIFGPIFLDIAVLVLHHFLVSCWGLNWTLMVVALGLNVLPLFTGYLAQRPNWPSNLQWWLVLLFISSNIECVMMLLSSCRQTAGKGRIYCNIYRANMGLLLIAHSLFFSCMHHAFKRQRLRQIMTERIMNAQIKGLGSLIPIGRRHAR